MRPKIQAQTERGYTSRRPAMTHAKRKEIAGVESNVQRDQDGKRDGPKGFRTQFSFLARGRVAVYGTVDLCLSQIAGGEVGIKPEGNGFGGSSLRGELFVVAG